MSRKKKDAEATPDPARCGVAPVVDGVSHPLAPRDGFPAWLDGMTATKPFTIADCTELHAMLKKDMPTCAAIDVCFDETHVHVRAYRTRDSLTADWYRTLELK